MKWFLNRIWHSRNEAWCVRSGSPQVMLWWRNNGPVWRSYVCYPYGSSEWIDWPLESKGVVEAKFGPLLAHQLTCRQ